MSQNEEKPRELIGAMYDELVEEGSLFTVSRGGHLTINSERITANNALQFLQGRCRKSPALNPLLLMEPVAFLALFRMVYTRKQTEAKTLPEFEDVQLRNYSYQGLIPFQSVTDGGKFVLFDTHTSEVTDLDYVSFKMNKEHANIEPITGRIEFNPYNPKPLSYKHDRYGRPTNFLNTYKKPAWQDKGVLPESEIPHMVPPPLFLEFMRHLIPSTVCREYVYDWLHYALTDRCETYLVLNGAKGVGKGILAEHFCKTLMGANNHKMAQPSALDSNFNALLKECRMIVFDEFRVDSPEKVNKLKRYVNEDQMIEHKGMDVGETTKTYNSFIIENNDVADMRIQWDDRRFSVVDLTKVKLQDIWPEHKRAELFKLVNDPEAVRAIGYWLMYRKPHHTKFDAWAGEHFHELCYSSFSEWQRIIVDFATSCKFEEIRSTDLKKEYRRRTEASRLPGFSKVKDFIENYRHKREYSLGEISKESHEVWSIQLAERFTPQETDERLLG